ncbi:CPBP family intramembrane metalloprotease [Jannaschia sp. Os4]|uniref:CPBP family intramembrane glutamic endopeptidase n=1 Tax=Jannaschia sp. Os4 TaxID=2807617 RepID=UPI001939E9B3|nr:type II CAAX endopeptidase family protein [Jannaschia sp. Os4]MBM2575160.1 CPBP family intramembrane metalloprotease [Jannaschia sp. Os4]
MWTPAFDRFVAPARRRPQIWRLVLGCVVAGVTYVGLFFGVIVAAALSLGIWPLDVALLELLTAETPRSVLIVLATFAGMMIGPMLAARLLHARSGRSLFGPGTGRAFVPALLITLGLFGAILLILPQPFALVPNLPPGAWAVALVPALAGLALQTGAEEVLFRGYLQQQLAARFRHPLVWMGLPSVLFGLGHFDPTSQGANAWLIVAATTLFGLVAADLTRATGSIGAAWGFHMANNMTAMLVLAVDGPLSGLALYVTPFDAADTETLRPLIAQDMIVTVIAWALLRLWFAKRGRSSGTTPRDGPT